MEDSKEPKPEITRVSVDFVQDGNTLGTTEECEQITIDLEFQLSGDDPFVVIKTDGWSMDDPEDLRELVDKAKQVLS